MIKLEVFFLQVLKSFLDKKDSFYSIHQIGTVRKFMINDLFQSPSMLAYLMPNFTFILTLRIRCLEQDSNL